ncbi:alpha/beta-hydrolase [Sparassis latifolia]
MSLFFTILTSLSGIASVFAFPVPVSFSEEPAALERREVTTLTSSQLADFAPYTEFARAAYCPSDIVTGWQCGEACAAVPGFEVSLTGGDGNALQLYYVGYWPQENAVVVAHEGTDPTQFLSDLTDADIITENLDSSLFPGVSSDIWVHSGFANEQAQTATTILTETNSLIQQYSATNVITVGHSLGGALAQLDALYLTLQLPSSIHIKSITYGTPRVGNSAYATYFDSMVPDYTRVNNELDIVPIVPGRFLGFLHPHGEVHIIAPDDAVSCPGDDDGTEEQCTDLSVPNILDGNIVDHLGPYQGIWIGTLFCT